MCAAVLAHAQGTPMGALVLCAPALTRAEPPADRLELRPPCPTTILHGRHDDVVPIAVSRTFVAQYPAVRLIEVDDDHRLIRSSDLLVELTRAALGTTS